MCSKQFWEQHAPFLATKKIIIIMSTITLLELIGIILTKGTCTKFKDSLEGEVKVKYKQPYGAGGVVTVPLKPTSISALCRKNLTSGLRGLSVWCTNSVKKKPT